MAEKKTLDEVFDRSVERWTQPISSMDLFTRRALSRPHFTQSVANFVESRMEKADENWRIPENAEAVPPLNLSDPRPQPPSVRASSEEKAHKKHLRALRKAQAS